MIEIDGQPFICTEEHTASESPDTSKFDELNTFIQAKRIYRTVFTEAGTEFQLVDEIPLGQNSYSDLKSDAETSDVLPSIGWDMPPEGMLGLTGLGTFMAGFKGHTIYLSEQNRPHA